MADLNLSQTYGGLKIVSENSSLILNEFSTKRNNLSKDEISIISDIKDSYAELDINFSYYDNVYFDGSLISDAEELESELEKIPTNISSGNIDGSTNAVNVIDYAHHEIHAGSHYFIKTWIDITGAGTVQYFMFTTPDTTKWIHAKSSMTAEAEFRIEIYEGGTVSDSGNLITAINNNRNSTNTPGLQAYGNPTVTGDGNLIWDSITGTARRSTGVSPAFGYEILAKQDEIYIFKITKTAAGTHYIDIDFWWYEHTSKNL